MLHTPTTAEYLSAFKDYQKNGAGRGPAWLKELRESAIASFEKLGFPTTRDEDWKYTSVDSVVSTVFERGEHNVGSKAVATEIRPLAFSGSADSRLVFVNGLYSPELSGLHRFPLDTRVVSLANALQGDDGVLRSHLSRYARY